MGSLELIVFARGVALPVAGPRQRSDGHSGDEVDV